MNIRFGIVWFVMKLRFEVSGWFFFVGYIVMKLVVRGLVMVMLSMVVVVFVGMSMLVIVSEVMLS